MPIQRAPRVSGRWYSKIHTVYWRQAGCQSTVWLLLIAAPNSNLVLNNVCVKQHPSKHLISQIYWTKPPSPKVGHVLVFRCFARSWSNCSSGISAKLVSSELEVADVSVSDVQELLEKGAVFAASACDGAGRCGPMAPAEPCISEYPIDEWTKADKNVPKRQSKLIKLN